MEAGDECEFKGRPKRRYCDSFNKEFKAAVTANRRSRRTYFHWSQIATDRDKWKGSSQLVRDAEGRSLRTLFRPTNPFIMSEEAHVEEHHEEVAAAEPAAVEEHAEAAPAEEHHEEVHAEEHKEEEHHEEAHAEEGSSEEVHEEEHKEEAAHAEEPAAATEEPAAAAEEHHEEAAAEAAPAAETAESTEEQIAKEVENVAIEAN